MSQAYDIQERVKSGERVTTDGRGSGRDELAMSPNAIWKRTYVAINRLPHDIPDFNVRLDGTVLSGILVSCLIVTQGSQVFELVRR